MDLKVNENFMKKEAYHIELFIRIEFIAFQRAGQKRCVMVHLGLERRVIVVAQDVDEIQVSESRPVLFKRENKNTITAVKNLVS